MPRDPHKDPFQETQNPDHKKHTKHKTHKHTHDSPPPPSPSPPPQRPSGCRSGDPNCGRGYICDRCYNSAVRPMGYAGVNRNAPPPPAPAWNGCQPVVYCRRWC